MNLDRSDWQGIILTGIGGVVMVVSASVMAFQGSVFGLVCLIVIAVFFVGLSVLWLALAKEAMRGWSEAVGQGLTLAHLYRRKQSAPWN